MLHLATFRIAGELQEAEKQLETAISKMDLGEWFGSTFKVFVDRFGDQGYKGQDIATIAGEMLVEKTLAKVSLSDPFTTFLIIIVEDKCHIGIDFSGLDLSKRKFRVFPHQSALNSAVAYALVRYSGFKQGVLLDPFCGSGTIPLEAGLYAQGISPHHFNKDGFAFQRFLQIDMSKFDKPKKSEARIIASDHLLKFLQATKSHAKLAGVDIDVTRMDIEWLDTKLDEKSVDALVTGPPAESRLHDPTHLQKLYKEFFHQAEYVLKDGGVMVVCMRKTDLFEKCIQGFKIKETHDLWQGGAKLKALMLGKNI